MSQWHLYLLRTQNGSLYAGITTDVARRLCEHRSGGGKCARSLRGKGPLRLVYKRRLGERSLALKVERRIKSLSKERKEEIVRSKPNKRDLIARLGITCPP
jgi:putative endonuclease